MVGSGAVALALAVVGGSWSPLAARVIDIEYRARNFRRACRRIGPRLSVVLRDRAVHTPAPPGYRFAMC
jgi:hypothetical protein